MKIDIVKLEKYRFGLNVMWEEIWTLPKRSDLLYAGLYIERNLW